MPTNELLTTASVGGYIIELLKAHLPTSEGEASFKEIAKDWAKGYGTTCGFLPMWAYFMAGCRNKKIISRSEPTDGIKYDVGRNISRIWNSGNPPFIRFMRGTTPAMGSTIYVSNGPPNTEHVCIFECEEQDPDGSIWWVTWDGGQVHPKTFKEAMFRKRRRVNGRLLGDRGIIGWLPVSALTFEAPPRDIKGSTAEVVKYAENEIVEELDAADEVEENSK